MGRLLYVTNTSLDGCIEDAAGSFAFHDPDPEYLAAITDLVEPVGTNLYGRRLYEAMAVWETEAEALVGTPDEARFAAWWQRTEKVVWSRTLDEVPTARTRVERRFDPDAVRALTTAADADLVIGGADLAGQALVAGLVDEVHLFVSPVAVGRGKPALPDARLDLELVGVRRFASGIVHLAHRTRP